MRGRLFAVEEWEMTQAELWNMQLLAAANASEAFQGVVTIIFAYLVTAYFVGRRLTRFQAAWSRCSSCLVRPGRHS
jgi:hypothetical protein